MNRFISSSFGLVSCCLITFACKLNNGQSPNKRLSSNDTLVIVGCQDKIEAEVGSILEIQLEAVPATGYEWLVKDSTSLLKEHKTDVIKYHREEGNSFQVLQFEAISKGIEIIHLEYRRVFEKGVEKQCTIEIEISESI